MAGKPNGWIDGWFEWVSANVGKFWNGTTLGTMTFGTVNDSVGSLASVRSTATTAASNATTAIAGGIAINNQVALDFIYASSASQLARLAKGTGLQYPRINAGANGWEFATLPSSAVLTLLYSASGTNTSVGAAALDSLAITGLTALDRLWVIATIGVSGGNQDGVSLYNSTSSVTLESLTGNHATHYLETILCSQANFGVSSLARKWNTSTGAVVNQTTTSFTWTNNWTLQFRSPNGITGTTSWSWTVYKIAGQ